eukprot:scaffold3651_cov128-Skeletonema_dohrnii-CCMP3373.AAC.6
MSTDDQTEAADICCALCGEELDDIKLKTCDACDLVKYCSDKCQQDHQPQHEAMCIERAAELRDEILFRQPESTHLGDCPICFLPLPLDLKNSMFSCCGKIICMGCDCANKLVLEREARLQPTCPFCRHPSPTTEEEAKIKYMKRVEKNDPVAMAQIGKKHYDNGDYELAFEYYTNAAELGDATAHNNLTFMYRNGQGIEKDEKKEVYHLEEAAIAGHPRARCNLAFYEWKNSRFDRAVKHWSIAANLGYDDSIQALKECYKEGKVSKDDFAAALRAHQAAVDATKSPQREAAKDNA